MDAPQNMIQVRQYTSSYPGLILECASADGSPLSSIAKLVYIALWSHANNRTASAFPAVNTLAKECSVKRRAVQYALADLEAVGLLERRPRYQEGGRQTSSLYMLNTPADARRPRVEGAPNARGEGAPNARGGCTECAPGGAPNAPKLDPEELDQSNISKEPPSDSKASKVSGDTVAVVSLYRETTGIQDVDISQASKWIQLHGLEKVKEKLGMLAREIQSGRRISRPRGWVAKALEEDWPPIDDKDSLAVEAAKVRNQRVIEQARKEEETRKAVLNDPAKRAHLQEMLQQAKAAIL